jgi:hypothetical protein
MASYIYGHNERGIQFLRTKKVLLLRYYATGTFQLACGDLCDISQPSESRSIEQVYPRQLLAKK